MLLLKNYFINLNIFEPSTDPTATDEEKKHEHRTNIIATRIFFIVFIIVLLGLTITTKTRSRNIHQIVENPSEDQFINLPSDAQCPCSRISLPYGEFITIQTQFHEICSSDFISDRWIKAVDYGLNTKYFVSYDFRTEASAIFQSLESFCRLSKDYVIQSIESLNKNLFISQEVLKESVFQSQTNAIINQFQLSSPIEFLTELKLLQKMILGNRFISALQTNYMQWYLALNNNESLIIVQNRMFTDIQASFTCSCRTHIDCKMESVISNESEVLSPDLFGPTDDVILMKIPGMSHSCLPINTILLSTLECFYNQTCLNHLLSFLPTNETFTSISDLVQNRHELKSTIQTIMNNLMIEEWMIDISFKKYYNQCASKTCTYFKNEKYDWKSVLTQLIGLLGTIVTLCSFIIQNLVAFIRQRPSQNIESIPCKFSRLTHYAKYVNYFSFGKICFYEHDHSEAKFLKKAYVYRVETAPV
ncbi:unnamed protein product [Rotaria sp. Silwood1]|nr:unnamed protein product [Rotaria sp. Silwood1]